MIPHKRKGLRKPKSMAKAEKLSKSFLKTGRV